jgi:Bacterial Ig domain
VPGIGCRAGLLVACLAALLGSMGFASGARAATDRIVVTVSGYAASQSGAEVFVDDIYPNPDTMSFARCEARGFTCSSSIPNTHFVRNGDTISFVDDDPVPTRCFKLDVFVGWRGPSQVSGYFLDPDGTKRDFGPYTLGPQEDGYQQEVSPGFTPSPCTPGYSFETPNAPPIARCDTYEVPLGGVLQVPAGRGVLANDLDFERDQLRALLQVTSFPRSRIDWDESTGAFTFRPARHERGLATISYVAQDSKGAQSAPADVRVGIGLAPPPCAQGNRPPVAKPDRWNVRAGWTADENVLLNDFDPDGDPITARIIEISFASKEWSRLDLDGGFLYTAGPGTSRVLNKRITYVAVDSKGATSQPATAVVRIQPLKPAKRTPMAKHSASVKPYWAGPWTGWARLCFGGGLDSYCYTILSVARTEALNGLTRWTNLSGAANACLKFGFIPLKNADCAKKLLNKSFFYAWDKSVVSNAAKLKYCVMFRVDRNRSLSHPRAGEWGKPEYRILDSLVKPFNGNQRQSGWGTWGKWRVPLFCESDGRVWAKVNQHEVTKP